MSIFHNKEKNGLPFYKEDVKREILERVPVELPEWKIIKFPSEFLSLCGYEHNPFGNDAAMPHFPDILAIRNIDIDKEIKITSNPFSDYKRIEPSVYQIVATIFLFPFLSTDKFSLEDLIREEGYFNDWRIVVANSYDMLVRKLREQN